MSNNTTAVDRRSVNTMETHVRARSLLSGEYARLCPQHVASPRGASPGERAQLSARGSSLTGFSPCPRGPWPPLAEPPLGPGALLEPNIPTSAPSSAEKREISKFWAENRNTSNCLVCPVCGSLSSQTQDFVGPYLKGTRYRLSGWSHCLIDTRNIYKNVKKSLRLDAPLLHHCCKVGTARACLLWLLPSPNLVPAPGGPGLQLLGPSRERAPPLHSARSSQRGPPGFSMSLSTHVNARTSARRCACEVGPLHSLQGS